MRQQSKFAGVPCEYAEHMDEFTIECKPEYAELVKEVSENAIVWAGKFYKIICPHKGDGKIGNNWYAVH